MKSVSRRRCGDYPAVRYIPPEGFGYDILTRLGEAFRYSERPTDRFDAAVLAERFGFLED